MINVIRGRNVDGILSEAVWTLMVHGADQASRNGPVISYPGIFATEIESPCERVLFNEKRKINPFLHLVDGLSILSDIDSVTPLSDIVGRFQEFSDDGVILRGHYGARLFSQLPVAIEMLRKDKDTRRVALSMWQSSLDLGTISKDIPCNLMVVPRVVDNRLNLTVFNRSNDLFWGMLGANVVQFSFLQEFLASAIYKSPGLLTQISTNAHIYTNMGPGKDFKQFVGTHNFEYVSGEVSTMPLVSRSIEATLADVRYLMTKLHERVSFDPSEFMTDFFKEVAGPMMCAFREHRAGDSQAADILPNTNNDWIVAGRRWLNRRA